MMDVEAPAKNAVLNDPHQGGNKSASRPGANNGIVEHPMVDRYDHGGIHARAKNAMAEHGMAGHKVVYHDGGERY